MNHHLIRNANVHVGSMSLGANKQAATISIGDRFHHVFSPNSRISKSLEIATVADLQERMNGGTYFFVEDEEGETHLMDFRDRHYNGFVHSGKDIDTLMSILGVEKVNPRRKKAFGYTTQSEDLVLSKEWDRHEIVIPAYREGGQFTSGLNFMWSPFHAHVRGTFELVRQICSNGMIARTDFLNTVVPVVNRWEEHLEIATRQIQTKVHGMVTNRLGEMDQERATVAELLLVANHCSKRLESEDQPEAARAQLQQIRAVVDPIRHLSRFYKDNVFDETALAAQVPGHLSTFALWNCATEIATHTEETEKSSNFALSKLANGFVFDKDDKRLQRRGRQLTAPQESYWSNAEMAFFGR